jgi:type 1 fimbriae regulatory protein FimB
MRYLTKDELTNVLRVAKADSPRNHAMLLVAYWHGMRASEVTALRGTDIRDGEITIRRLKGSLKSTHPLVSDTDPLYDEKSILERLAADNPGVLFPIHRTTFWRFFQGYQAAAGIKQGQAHPHILKHSIAMHSRKAGIEMVQTYLGHKNINNTRVYWTISDEEAATAIARVRDL